MPPTALMLMLSAQVASVRRDLAPHGRQRPRRGRDVPDWRSAAVPVGRRGPEPVHSHAGSCPSSTPHGWPRQAHLSLLQTVAAAWSTRTCTPSASRLASRSCGPTTSGRTTSATASATTAFRQGSRQKQRENALEGWECQRLTTEASSCPLSSKLQQRGGVGAVLGCPPQEVTVSSAHGGTPAQQDAWHALGCRRCCQAAQQSSKPFCVVTPCAGVRGAAHARAWSGRGRAGRARAPGPQAPHHPARRAR